MRDMALPPAAQEGLMKASGVEWAVREIDSGHCPFVTSFRELAGVVGELVKGFQ